MRRSCAAAALAAVLVCGLPARPAAADDPFRGRWASDLAGCAGGGAANAPLTVTATSVSWSKSTCTIKKSYRIGDTLALQANCSGGGRTGVIPIGLTLRGRDRLSVIWDQTPAGEMRRCR
jgi:hypothetical protein